MNIRTAILALGLICMAPLNYAEQNVPNEKSITITSRCGKGFAKAFTVTGRVVMRRITGVNGPPKFRRAFSIKKIGDRVIKEEITMDFIHWFIGIKDDLDKLPLDKDSTLAVYETFEALGNPAPNEFIENPSSPDWRISPLLVVLKILP